MLKRLILSLTVGALCTIGTAWYGAFSDTTMAYEQPVEGYGPEPATDRGVEPHAGTVNISSRLMVTRVTACAPCRMYVCGNAAMSFDSDGKNILDEKGNPVLLERHSFRDRPWGSLTPYWACTTVASYLNASPPDQPLAFRKSTICGYGWPMRVAYFEFNTNLGTSGYRQELKGGLPLPCVANAQLVSYRGFGVTLPTIPIWPGVLANTAIVSSALWLVLGAIAPLRRQLRVGRGRCASCNYDLCGLNPGALCPECGESGTLSVPCATTTLAGSGA